MLSLGACQGNIGSGSGLSIPQAAAPYQPNGPGQTTTSRERVLEGAVYLSSASPLASLPLPLVAGFGIEINLGTPGPFPSPSPSPTASGSAAPRKFSTTKRTHTSAVAHHSYALALLSAVASPMNSPAVSSAPENSAIPASPVGVTHLSDAPSPNVSGSPIAAPSSAPGAISNPAAHHHTHASTITGPKIVTKTVVYPDDAPVAPTPEPTGAVQTFPIRKALVRGYLMPAVDVPIYGLAAVHFTLPRDEVSATRGYTIAIFTSAKKHRGKLLEYDSSPTVGSLSIASTYADDPLVFKKNIGYEIVLYADPGTSTPLPIPSGYPGAGSNPLPYPSGSVPAPGGAQPGVGQTAVPYGYPTPSPSQTFFR